MSNSLEYAVETGVVATEPPAPLQRQTSVVAHFWQRRVWVVKATIVGLVLGAIVAFVIPKRYESTAQLMPPDSSAISGMAMMGLMAGGNAGGTVGLANSILSGKTPSAQFVGILGSRTVQDSLIDRFDLRSVYRLKFYTAARKQLAKYTELSEDRKTGMISITVRDANPQRARDLAQAYVEELNKTVSRVSTSSARRERLFLEERLQAVEKELAADSRELSEFSSRNATLDPQAQGRATIEGAARLQGDLSASESELSGIETIYSDNNTRVRAMRARIAELKSQMRKLAGNRQETGGDLEESQLYPSLRKLPLLGVTYFDLYRRVKVQETVYEALMKQYELAKVQEAKEIPTISLLDAPLVPEKKVYPPRLLFTLLSGGLAFLFALGWIALERELRKKGIDRISRLAKAETWQKLGIDLQADSYA
jgi:capsule polysaccharide export protein KpsE/RkpR